MKVRTLWHGVACAALTATLLPIGAFAAPVVAPMFTQYYTTRQGIRVLGNPIGRLETADSHFAQYFEKGLIEDHRHEDPDPAWQFMYGRLAADLLLYGSTEPIGGENSDLEFAGLGQRGAKLEQSPSPATNGPIQTERGWFIPYNSELKAGPGHYVPQRFWDYINRADLFPAGWLHDVGLPMTEALEANVTKAGVRRTILVQAFERTVLTYDAQNPADFQVERDNIGVAHRRAFPPGYADEAILAAVNGGIGANAAFTAGIERVEGDFARAILYPNDPNATDPAWVWLRRDSTIWKVFGGPGTEFDDAFYNRHNVPDQIRIGNPLEQAMYTTLQSWIPANSSVRDFTTSGFRLEAGVAKVTVNAVGVETDPAFAFLRIVDENRWEVLGLGTGFDDAWYQQNEIPEVLR